MISNWMIIEAITSSFIFVGVFYPEKFFIAGSCVDKHNYCSGWASGGQCTKNPLWMLQNCPKSCKVCSGVPACVNIYNDQYCEMHFGNCWRQSTAANLVKNCRKTCVCKCFPSTPVTLPTTATLSSTTTTNVSTACQSTTATILYSTTTGEGTTETTTTPTATTTTGTKVLAKTSILHPTTRTINGTRQDLDAREKSGLNTLLLSAIVAGVVVGVGIFGVVALWFWRRKRSGSLNQQKWPPPPPVQGDSIRSEEIIWLERQPRQNSRNPVLVSVDTAATNCDNQVITKDSPKFSVAETIPQSPGTPLYHVLEDPYMIRDQPLSVHCEQSSGRFRSDSDYDEPMLNEARAAIGLPPEDLNTKGFTNAAFNSETLDGNDEYCYSYTIADHNLSLKSDKNRLHEVPKTERPYYHSLEGPNAGYQALESAQDPTNDYTPMAGITELSGYQPLQKSIRSVYQPLKKTNETPRRVFKGKEAS